MFNVLVLMSVAFGEEAETVENTETNAEATQTMPEPFKEQITLAKQQIKSNSLQAAEDSLNKAQKEVAKVESILTSSDISEIWYLRGVVQSLKGEDPLESWRQTLIINLGQEWNADLVKDEALRDLFLALKTEVQNRKIVSVQHPEQYGQAKLYVDGFLRAPGDFVYQGEHFAQIECPKGDVHSKWTDFEKTFKWIKMCPYKFDVTDMPEPEAVDEWDMFGGFADEETAPDVNMSNQVVAAPLFERMNKPTLYGSVGTAAAAGMFYGLALKNNQKFDDLENGLSVEELDSLRGATNTIAISSMTFGIVSGGLYMYSMSTARISE